MHGAIDNALPAYGYAFVFLIVGLESFGIPLPGETTLVTAAAFAALGRLNIYGVVGSAAAGAILGDNAGYWLGRKGGMAFVRRFGRHVRLDERKIDRVHGFFDRHGTKAVFIGRFVPLLRSWAAILAGVAHMPYATFVLCNALGVIAWSSLFGTLGYAFGHNLPRLERDLGRAGLAAALLITLVAGLARAARPWRVRRRRRRPPSAASRPDRVRRMARRFRRAPDDRE